MPEIAVLGAGVVGLSTAVCIQKRIPNARVTIIADKFDKDTISDGAAGIFRPTTEKTKAKSEEQLRQWCKISFDWFDSVYKTEEGHKAGIIQVSGYEVMNEKKNYPLHHLMDYSFREMSEDEVKKLPGNYKYGWACSTLMIECRRYLPWLMEKFICNHGKVIRRKIDNIFQFSEAYDVIVNCLGLSCRWLLDDPEVFPVRGHLVRLKAPWIKGYFVISGGDTYIYPGQDNVVLGGTRHEGEYNLDYKPEYFQNIIDRCSKIYPSLKDAEVERVWVGLRPHRTTVRVEKEYISLHNHISKIVHNYGHGANGIALSWGTAEYASHLTMEMLQDDNVIGIRTQSKL